MQSVFYVTGSVGTLWFILWMIFIRDDPDDHFLISETERDFILQNRAKSDKAKGVPPYLSILSTLPVWVMIMCDFANGWGVFMLLTEGPNFFDKVLHQDIKSVRKASFNYAPQVLMNL